LQLGVTGDAMELLSDDALKGLKAPLAIAAVLLLLWALLLSARPARFHAQTLAVDQPVESAGLPGYVKPSPFEARKKAPPTAHHAARRAATVSAPDSAQWNPADAIPVSFGTVLPEAR
jgi:hypothetical protein